MPTFLAPAVVSTTNNYSTYGTAPAGSGVIRLSNGAAQAITWRNAANSNDIQALYVTSSDDLWCNTASGKNLYMAHGGAAIAQWSSLGLQFNPGFNIVTYGAGFKIGGTSAEKISFWGSTPIAQPANTVAIDDVLVNTGLRASGGLSNFTAAITIGTSVASVGLVRLPNNTGMFWRNAANSLDGASIQMTTSDRIHYGATNGHTFFNSGVQAFTHTAGGLDVAGYISTAGITGAAAASRLVGATTSGKPVSGTFVKGDMVVDQTGKIWINTTAGSPGTWTDASSASSYYSIAKWGVD